MIFLCCIQSLQCYRSQYLYVFTYLQAKAFQLSYSSIAVKPQEIPFILSSWIQQMGETSKLRCLVIICFIFSHSQKEYGTFTMLNTPWILNIYYYMKNFEEIKGDTANSAGRHQTWVLALTFSMTIEQSNSQGELY